MKTKIALVLFCLCVFGTKALLRYSNGHCKEQSQLSENEEYLDFCARALKDDEAYASFKRSSIYNLFHEGLSFEIGTACLDTVLSQTPELLDSRFLEKIRELDCVGRPHVHTYGFAGPLSPATLFYLKVASDLKIHFGEMERMRIIEINGGNGGLCKVLHDVFDIDQYTIIDLKASAELARKHLVHHGLNHIQFLSPKEAKLMECDLLISCEGLTEANKTLQKRYLKHLLPGAKKGYITCHFLPKHFGLKGLKKGELLKKVRKIRPVEIQPQSPQTDKESCIITWSDI